MTGRGAESDTLNFIKIVKKDEYTTYLLELHSYTQEDPYFLKLIITQDDQETKLGHVKYIPDFEIPYINPSSFTGSIQMLNIDMEIAAENYFINGVLQPSSSHNTAARGVDGCTSTTVIITHNCTNGGNHAPGEPCGTKKNPLENDGYYEVRLTVFCPGDDPLAEVPEVFIDIAGPSGGATPANPVDPNIALAAVSFKLYGELTRSQKLWWDNTNNSALKNDLINYLNDNSTVLVNGLLDGEALAFVKWAIDYLRANPSVTTAQFKNWFMAPSEGQDWDYNSAFWENPNLSYPQQNLPSRDAYKAGMPKFEDGTLMTGADNVYNLVGGAVLQVRNQYPPKKTNNTCALKVSIALNRSGVVIPNLPGKTIEGGGDEFTGKFFFLNAKALNAWMRETFGTNPATSTIPYNEKHLSFTGGDGGTNGENFPNLPELQNISGIYSMVTVEGTNEASGHADYIYTNTAGNVTCPFDCFFNLQIERIDVWILE